MPEKRLSFMLNPLTLNSFALKVGYIYSLFNEFWAVMACDRFMPSCILSRVSMSISYSRSDSPSF